jgi:hypothetical protein
MMMTLAEMAGVSVVAASTSACFLFSAKRGEKFRAAGNRIKNRENHCSLSP